MSNRTLNLTDELYSYILRQGIREHSLLKQLRDETKTHRLSQMQIAPEQGQFMSILIKLMGVKRIIEVGVFTGYSSLAMALALPEDGHILACDINEDYTVVARRYWDLAGVTHKVDLRLGPAKTTLDDAISSGESESYDLAFIDADKTGYDDYYESCLQLLRSGGLIMIDNVLWGGAVVDEQANDEDTLALRALNTKIHKDSRVDMTLLPIADGLTLARKL